MEPPPDGTNSPVGLMQRLCTAAEAGAAVTNELYHQWLRFYMTNVVALREVRTYELAGEGKVRVSLGAQVYGELLRMFAAVVGPRMPDMASATLASAAQHPVWARALSSFEANAAEDDNDDEDAVRVRDAWATPISEYTRAQLVALVMLLTQMAVELPHGAVDEVYAVFDAVRLRAPAVLLGTRDSAYFCACYVGELHRRFYYYDAIVGQGFVDDFRAPPDGGQRVRAWMERVVIPAFPAEALVDLYASVCEETYRAYVGDRLWFPYCFPNAIVSTGAILGKLRPHLQRRFFSEQDMNVKLLVEHAAHGTHHAARLLMLRIVTKYIQMRWEHFSWDDAVVLSSEDMDYDAEKLVRPHTAPLLVQVLSNYWAYDDRRVFITDNAFESIAAWFHVLRERYACALYRQRADVFRELIEEALGEGR